MDKQQELDVKALNNLKNGEHYVVPESDYGRAEIWLINNAFFVFEIPMYGGEPNYVERFFLGYTTYPEQKQKAIDDVMNLVYSWT